MNWKLEIKNPKHVRVESDGENSLDGSNPDDDDRNHRVALREWHCFEEYKKQRYIPKIKYGRALSKDHHTWDRSCGNSWK